MLIISQAILLVCAAFPSWYCHQLLDSIQAVSLAPPRWAPWLAAVLRQWTNADHLPSQYPHHHNRSDHPSYILSGHEFTNSWPTLHSRRCLGRILCHPERILLYHS
ncbi:hypothetical protein EDB87DRAFT_1615974 [Lactarius vividus]|nr:hypothetical protein EDB87DRAFT_1615974 [Lactarius vividus]